MGGRDPCAPSLGAVGLSLYPAWAVTVPRLGCDCTWGWAVMVPWLGCSVLWCMAVGPTSPALLPAALLCTWALDGMLSWRLQTSEDLVCKMLAHLSSETEVAEHGVFGHRTARS